MRTGVIIVKEMAIKSRITPMINLSKINSIIRVNVFLIDSFNGVVESPFFFS